VDVGDMGLSGIVVVLIVFLAIGVAMIFQSFRAEKGGEADSSPPRGLGLRAAVDAYVGPVSPENAFLNAPGRVALEFVAAMCGFPGFGWLSSTRVRIGLPLMVVAPAIVYGAYPMYLVLSGHILDRPLIGLEYLPVVAVVSATALAIAEVRSARGRRNVAAN
jgi:hypothetical protein